MKVTVELTDEQADFYGEGNYHCDAERVLGDAIVAARPKPLKVGDSVFAGRHWYRVIGFGTTPEKWMVGLYLGLDRPMMIAVDKVTDERCNPIVWPAS